MAPDDHARMAAIDLTLASAGIAATSLAYPRATVVAGALTLLGSGRAPEWSRQPSPGHALGHVGATVISIADLASVITPNFGTIHNIVPLYLLGARSSACPPRWPARNSALFEISVRAQEAYAERERPGAHRP